MDGLMEIEVNSRTHAYAILKNMDDIKTILANDKDNTTQNKNYMSFPGINGTFLKNQIEYISFLNKYPYDYIPDYFCHECSRLFLRNDINLENVKNIGNNFFCNCLYVSTDIILPEIEMIGSRFLLSARKMFNNKIIFGNKLKSIGTYFMSYGYESHNMQFNNPIIFPNSIERIDFEYFMNGITHIPYIKVPHHFPELVENWMNGLNSNQLSSYPQYILSHYKYETDIKIKGLTEAEFNKLHELLPDKLGGNNRRKLIYDGLE